jgi:hypothetical protein
LRAQVLAFWVDDLGAPRALGLGLATRGADHALVEVDAISALLKELAGSACRKRAGEVRDIYQTRRPTTRGVSASVSMHSNMLFLQ